MIRCTRFRCGVRGGGGVSGALSTLQHVCQGVYPRTHTHQTLPCIARDMEAFSLRGVRMGGRRQQRRKRWHAWDG